MQEEQGMPVDPRTRLPIPKAPSIENKPSAAQNERQKLALLFKSLKSNPGYEELRKIAYASCAASPLPKDLSQAIQFGFQAIRRSSYDYLFNLVDTLSETIKEVEDTPVVEGYRPSFFGDNRQFNANSGFENL